MGSSVGVKSGVRSGWRGESWWVSPQGGRGLAVATSSRAAWRMGATSRSADSSRFSRAKETWARASRYGAKIVGAVGVLEDGEAVGETRDDGLAEGGVRRGGGAGRVHPAVPGEQFGAQGNGFGGEAGRRKPVEDAGGGTEVGVGVDGRHVVDRPVGALGQQFVDAHGPVWCGELDAERCRDLAGVRHRDRAGDVFSWHRDASRSTRRRRPRPVRRATSWPRDVAGPRPRPGAASHRRHRRRRRR